MISNSLIYFYEKFNLYCLQQGSRVWAREGEDSSPSFFLYGEQ